MATLIKKTFNWDFLLIIPVLYHRDREHGSMHIDMVLEQRVLCLSDNRKLTGSHSKGSLSKRDLKACPHSDTLPPTRPHHPVMPLPFGAIFF